MCYHIAYFTEDASYYEERFNATIVDGEVLPPTYQSNGYSHLNIPVITNTEPGLINLYSWGLIPHWVNKPTREETLEKAKGISNGNLNARNDTIFEKPSFRGPIRGKRCLVLVDGFYEYMHYKGKKYPHYIYLKDHKPFALAGIWSVWKYEDIIRHTVSIITTEPNPLMEVLHNSKKRMPLILPRELEKKWIGDIPKGDLGKQETNEMMLPFDENEMRARSIRPLTGVKGTGNQSLAMEHYGYDDLVYLEQVQKYIER